jgi:CRISPR-associated endonuclease Csn1
VGLLYGAPETGVDPEGRRRVEASRGQVTAQLRGRWGLNAVLGGGEKTRDDHRQHAIDAIVVALTDAGTIKRFSDDAAHAALTERRLGRLEPPWRGLLDDVRKAVEGMVVSHRVSRKVSGALHEETVYSKPHQDEEGKEFVHVRRPLGGPPKGLSEKEVADIVDRSVRERVKAKLEELGEKDPRKAFKDPKNHPALRAKDGREIPIHSVRVRVRVSPELIGGGAYARRVKLGSNHHVEIVEATDKKGNPRWEGHVVTTKEAMRRLKAREPIVQGDHGPGKRFLFSLADGEIVELNAEQDKRALYVIRTVRTDRRVEFVGITDARKKGSRSERGTIKGEGAWFTAAVDKLRERGSRKVVVTPVGEVRWASD